MERKENLSFSWKNRIRSFIHALNGLKILIREEHNSRIHFVIAIIVVVLGFLFGLSAIEWAVICLVIGCVVIAEIFNSAIENLADYVSPDFHHLIKKVKDLAAAAVFVSAIIAVIIGLIIFIPKILIFF